MQKENKTKKEDLVLEAVNLLIEVLIREAESIICNETYYKNQFLEEAIKEHVSLQCVVRTYAEMLKASASCTKNNLDLLHANAILDYLRIYDDERSLEYINDLFYFLRQNSRKDFPYLIAKSSGRIKSFMSFEAKERNKLLRFEIYQRLKQATVKELQALYEEKKSKILELFIAKATPEEAAEKTDVFEKFCFCEEDETEVKEYVQKLLAKNTEKKPCKDIVGYRVVVYSVNCSTDEAILKEFLYSFKDNLKDFFLNEGFECTSETDYVKNPKPNQYQSLHLVIDVLQIPVEVQIRTKKMDHIAEEGSAAHDQVYKDSNAIYIKLKEMLYTFSDSVSKKDTHELLGLLEPLDCSNKPWSSTPQEEIPYTPKELVEFPDKDFIQRCLGCLS